jgi:hypothetical protein
VTQDVLDDTSCGDRRDDAQPALLTHRAGFHGNGTDPFEPSRPSPVQRGR